MIDLRSDTVTIPTAEMREAMAQAPVGDDVYGEDPTVNALEERVAEILGKDAAIYMSSGTMTNQVAVRTHTEPGDEILIDKNAHIYFYEAGGTAALSGVICSLISGERGVFGAKEMEAVISEKEPHTTIMRPVDLHLTRTKLVCLENTTNRGGGKVWPLEKIAEVEKVARSKNLKRKILIKQFTRYNKKINTKQLSNKSFIKFMNCFSSNFCHKHCNWYKN